MPQLLTMIQVEKVTPAPSVIVMTLLALCYLTSSDILVLMNYVGFATWLSIGVAVFCLPYLRWKQPELARPIKVHTFYPWKNLTIFLLSAFLWNFSCVRTA